jgi:hypothetical protein
MSATSTTAGNSTTASAKCSLFIGIDDTDNLESRGTGFRVRELARELREQDLADIRAITRHQLYVSPDIPYTSHNSSACLRVQARWHRQADVVAYCRDYLLRESAPGSDAGLCVIEESRISDRVRHWGARAKDTVLTQTECRDLARAEAFILEGLTGDQGGVIGATAAVGLCHAGNDGRFLWARGVRDLDPGTYRLGQLLELTDIDEFREVDGDVIDDPGCRIEITEWARPVLLAGRAVLLLEESDDKQNPVWRVAAKDIIKRY